MALYPYMDINLHASDTHYAFLSPSNPHAPTLLVERPSGDLRLSESKISGAKRISSISGILGIIRLRLDKYIIVITKSIPVGKLRGSVIYKIISTDILPLHERPLHDSDEDTYLSILRGTLRHSPMYFSYNLDLTNAFQRQSRVDPSQPLWQRADERFFWNRFISSDLIDIRNGKDGAGGFRLALGPQPGIDPFILPVMSGTMSIAKTSVKGNPVTFALMTRKNRHRTGTRFFSRGMDEYGHVSNFNETEQVIVLNDDASGPTSGFGSTNGAASPTSGGRDVQIFSYIQTRGSVPAFWNELNNLKYTPTLQIRGVESAVPAAKLHFHEQIETYGDNYMINLVNQKGRENRVKEAYETVVRSLLTLQNDADSKAANTKSPDTIKVIEAPAVQQEFDKLHYVYFDFHHETSKFRWHRAQLLLDELAEPLHRQAYFHGIYSASSTPAASTAKAANASARIDIRSTQKSVVRTNCMDCLDRTNVIQSMLGRQAITRQLVDAGVLRRGESPFEDQEFEHLFRNVWADNADTVSKSYSGTGALKTDFTRTGQRTRQGALQDGYNSVTRYLLNNFRDGPRQDGYDLFCGAFIPDESASPGSLVFVDRRPLVVQAIPYILAACLFLLLVANMTVQLPDSGLWGIRFGMLISTAIGGWCIMFMAGHGTLYINWPKLKTPTWAQEGYNDGMSRAERDPVVGGIVARERGKHAVNLGGMEEGKKRVE
ncbi:MAG: hypothetical protein Q9159_000455 [Coniocarpon cinnabarinum]